MRGSSRILDELENIHEFTEIIMKLRYAHHYTMKKNYKLFGAEQTVGYLAAESAIDTIISNATTILYEHHLERKKNPHIFHSTVDLAELSLVPQYMEEDQNEYVNILDIEPELPGICNYMRGRIPHNKAHQPKENDQKSKLWDSQMTFSNLKVYVSENKAKEEAKNFLFVTSSDGAGVLEVPEVREYDAVEEQLRHMKKIDTERRDREKKAKEDHDREMAEQQRRLGRNRKDLDQKKYTYDFNGRIVFCKKVNVEALPKYTFQPKFTVRMSKPKYDDDTSETSRVMTQAPAEVLSAIVRHKAVPHQEKEFVKAVIPKHQPSIGPVKPQSGVVVVQNGEKMRGKKFTSSSVDLSERFQDKDGGTSKRLTVKQYEKQVKHIQDVPSTENLKTEEKNKGEEMPTQRKEEVASQRRDEIPTQRREDEKPPQRVMIRGGERDHSPLVKARQKRSEVRVHSSNLLKDILQPGVAVGSLTERNPRLGLEVEKPLRKTPVDEFNIEIINAREWGSNISGKDSPEPYLLPKIDQKQWRASLGIKQKYPRERGIVHNSVSIRQSSANTSRSVNRNKTSEGSPPASFFK